MKRKAAHRTAAVDERAWRPQRAFEALGHELLATGKARIMGYAELRLSAERRQELRTAGVIFRA
jgi:serine/threonine protein kinase HipA of HipAB toxin-antitoxin module